MGTFTTQETTPTVWTDKVAAPGLQYPQGLDSHYVWRADDAQTVKAALLDLRTAVRGLRFHVKDFGATPVNGYVADALPAFLAAKAAAVAAGGSAAVEGDGGVLYDLSGTYNHGAAPFVDVADIDGITAYTALPSYDSALLQAARAHPPISFIGNGCFIRGNFSSSVGKAVFTCFIADSHLKTNQDNFYVGGFTVVGKEGYTGNPPVQAFTGSRGALSGSNHQAGYYSVLCSAVLGEIGVRELDRGGVISDCYSAVRGKLTASHCNKNWEIYKDNGSTTIGIKSLLCEGTGFTVTGQGVTLISPTTEQNETDLYIPQCDGVTIINPYFENTILTDTGFGIKLGDIANSASSQAIKVTILGGHLSRTAGTSIRVHSTVYARILSLRSYATGALANNAGCSVLVDGYPLDVTANAYSAEAFTQFCPSQPGGTLQLGGASGSICMQLVEGARLALGGGNRYLYADSSRIITLAGLYAGGNFEVGGQSFLGTLNGPGGTTDWLFQNNRTDGASAIGYDFAATGTLANAAALIGRFRTGGSTRFSIFGLGDIEVNTAGKGVIVKSPDGTIRARLGIDNAGALTVTAL